MLLHDVDKNKMINFVGANENASVRRQTNIFNATLNDYVIMDCLGHIEHLRDKCLCRHTNIFVTIK